MLGSGGQHEVLDHKLYIHDTAGIPLEVHRGTCGLPHAATHIDDRPAQLGAIANATQDVATDAIERGTDFLVAGHRSRAHQRLMLPDPCVVGLILLEGRERTHHRARLTRRPQARVDVVQRAGVRARRENVQQTTHHTMQEAVVLRVEVVQEHDVEVRTRAEFESTELAEADDRERLRRRLDRFGGAFPGELQRLLQNHLGQKRQIVRNVHQRQDAAHLARRDAELMRFLEPPQYLEFCLFAATLHCAQSGPQFSAQRLDVGNRVQQRRIEQFVEQHGMPAQLIGEPAACAADLDQQTQRAWVFEQQDIVGRAAHRRFEQRHQPLQREVGVSRRLRFPEQLRNQRIDARTALSTNPRPVARSAQPVDQHRNRIRLAETDRRQRRGQRGHIAREPGGLPLIDLGCFVRLDHRFERLRNDRALLGQCLSEVHKIGETHAHGDSRSIEFARRKQLCLLVADRLQAVLDVA